MHRRIRDNAAICCTILFSNPRRMMLSAIRSQLRPHQADLQSAWLAVRLLHPVLIRHCCLPAEPELQVGRRRQAGKVRQHAHCAGRRVHVTVADRCRLRIRCIQSITPPAM